MDFHSATPSPSSTTSITTTPHPPHSSWWESISKARSRIHLLISLLPTTTDPLSSLADTDRPARSLLHSSAAYSSLSSALSFPTSGSPSDPLCQWLYDTFLSSDPDLRLVVLSYLPLLSSLYLHRVHHPSTTTTTPSFAGFEAVLLALYSSETKSRNGKPVTITIPDLSQPSLYHSPRSNQPGKPNPNPSNKNPLIGVISDPLEPQVAIKSTKRACIVGVALDCYYKQISHMPSWSKIDFCKFATVWAGQICPCTSEFDQKPPENFDVVENGEHFECLAIEDGNSEEDARIPLPWELLQPILRILGHCLLGPLNADEVKDAAYVAVRRLYARASHDLVPQAILATRSLIRLDKGAREAAAMVAVNGSSSNANTPSKAKKPEILLVSK